ncbi:MAG: hypothetical protein KC646_10165 [Candidatus Cloacimonetes bacterium]|nr:hypothetical protein [Candidatus Cloacimonadota bacterium]
MSNSVNEYYEKMTKEAIAELSEFRIMSSVGVNTRSIKRLDGFDAEIIKATNFKDIVHPIYVSVIGGSLQINGDYGDAVINMALHGYRNLRSYANMHFSYFYEKERGNPKFRKYIQELFFDEITEIINERLEEESGSFGTEEYHELIEYTEGLYLDDDNEICMDDYNFPSDEYEATIWLRENGEKIVGDECWYETIPNCVYPTFRLFFIWQMIKKIDQLLYPHDYEEIEGFLKRKKVLKTV